MGVFDDIRKQYPGWNDRDIVADIAAANERDPREVASYYGVGNDGKQPQGLMGDMGNSLVRGVQQLPRMVTGILDLPTALTTGHRPFTAGMDAVGFDGSWAKDREQRYSQGYQDSQAEVNAAWEQVKDAGLLDQVKEVFTNPDIAKAYLQNPAYTLNQVVESLPSMAAGGVASRGLMGIGKVAGTGAGALERSAGKWAVPLAAGAGEGAVTAGQQMGNFDMTKPLDEQRQNAWASLAAGSLTGGIGVVGGRFAQHMGLETPETYMAGRLARHEAVDALDDTGRAIVQAGKPADVPWIQQTRGRRIAGGALNEAVLQEMPQSMQEQAFQNIGEGKPWQEGVVRGGVEGAMAGGLMGAGFNAGGRVNEQKQYENLRGQYDTHVATTQDQNAAPEDRLESAAQLNQFSPQFQPQGLVAMQQDALRQQFEAKQEAAAAQEAAVQKTTEETNAKRAEYVAAQVALGRDGAKAEKEAISIHPNPNEQAAGTATTPITYTPEEARAVTTLDEKTRSNPDAVAKKVLAWRDEITKRKEAEAKTKAKAAKDAAKAAKPAPVAKEKPATLTPEQKFAARNQKTINRIMELNDELQSSLYTGSMTPATALQKQAKLQEITKLEGVLNGDRSQRVRTWSNETKQGTNGTSVSGASGQSPEGKSGKAKPVKQATGSSVPATGTNAEPKEKSLRDKANDVLTAYIKEEKTEAGKAEELGGLDAAMRRTFGLAISNAGGVSKATGTHIMERLRKHITAKGEGNAPGAIEVMNRLKAAYGWEEPKKVEAPTAEAEAAKKKEKSVGKAATPVAPEDNTSLTDLFDQANAQLERKSTKAATASTDGQKASSKREGGWDTTAKKEPTKTLVTGLFEQAFKRALAYADRSFPNSMRWVSQQLEDNGFSAAFMKPDKLYTLYRVAAKRVLGDEGLFSPVDIDAIPQLREIANNLSAHRLARYINKDSKPLPVGTKEEKAAWETLFRKQRDGTKLTDEEEALRDTFSEDIAPLKANKKTRYTLDELYKDWVTRDKHEQVLLKLQSNNGTKEDRDEVAKLVFNKNQPKKLYSDDDLVLFKDKINKVLKAEDNLTTKMVYDFFGIDKFGERYAEQGDRLVEEDGLIPQLSYKQIAEKYNAEGYTDKEGKDFTEKTVQDRVQSAFKISKVKINAPSDIRDTLNRLHGVDMGVASEEEMGEAYEGIEENDKDFSVVDRIDKSGENFSAGSPHPTDKPSKKVGRATKDGEHVGAMVFVREALGMPTVLTDENGKTRYLANELNAFAYKNALEAIFKNGGKLWEEQATADAVERKAQWELRKAEVLSIGGVVESAAKLKALEQKWSPEDRKVIRAVELEDKAHRLRLVLRSPMKAMGSGGQALLKQNWDAVHSGVEFADLPNESQWAFLRLLKAHTDEIIRTPDFMRVARNLVSDIQPELNEVESKVANTQGQLTKFDNTDAYLESERSWKEYLYRKTGKPLKTRTVSPAMEEIDPTVVYKDMVEERAKEDAAEQLLAEFERTEKEAQEALDRAAEVRRAATNVHIGRAKSYFESRQGKAEREAHKAKLREYIAAKQARPVKEAASREQQNRIAAEQARWDALTPEQQQAEVDAYNKKVMERNTPKGTPTTEETAKENKARMEAEEASRKEEAAKAEARYNAVKTMLEKNGRVVSGLALYEALEANPSDETLLAKFPPPPKKSEKERTEEEKAKRLAERVNRQYTEKPFVASTGARMMGAITRLLGQVHPVGTVMYKGKPGELDISGTTPIGTWLKVRAMVYDTITDAPENIQKEFADNDQALAWVGSHAIFIADRISQHNEVGTILHEVGVHVGLIDLLGKGNKKAGERKIAELVELVHRFDRAGTIREKAAYKAALARIPKDTPHNLKGQELLGYLVEELTKRRVKPLTGTIGGKFLHTLLTLVRMSLRAIGFKHDISGQELVYLIQGSMVQALNDPTAHEKMYKQGAQKASSKMGVAAKETADKMFDTSFGTDLQHYARKAVDSLTYTHDLVDKYEKLLPAAREWYNKMVASMEFKLGLERKVEDIVASVKDQKDRDAINSFLKFSTVEQKWGHQFKWLGRTVAVDPAAARQWNALTQTQKDVAEAVFKHGQEMLQMKRDIIKEAGDGELLKKMSELQGPYVPLKRFGNFIAVWKSAALVAAERADDKKKAEELKSDPKNYIVSFFDTPGAAHKFVAENRGREGRAYQFAKYDQINKGQLPYAAIGKILSAVKADKNLEGPVRSAMERTVRDLYLSTLDEFNSRQAGQLRKNRAGAAEDMLRSFLVQGRADAAFVSSVKHGENINASFYDMQRQADEAGDRVKATDGFNAITGHYASMLEYKPTPVQDALVGATSFWTLATNISYHLQNMTQPLMVTLPMLEGEFGMAKAWGAFMNGYGQMLKGMKKDGTIDLSKITNPRLRAALEKAQVEMLLDVGMEEDLGKFDKFTTGYKGADVMTDAARTVMNKTRGIARRVEMYNRVSAGAMAYELAAAKWGDAEGTKYMLKSLRQTQGDYARLATPLLLKHLPKPMVQFKKYQIMMATLYMRAFHDAFAGATQEEKDVARRQIVYLLGHAAVAAGATGLPVATVAAAAMSLGGGDEPKDLERSIKQAFGPELGTLIAKGVPAAMGWDWSAKMGQDKIFSILPYTDVDFSKPKSLMEAVGALAMGPAGGVAAKMADGYGLMKKGDVYKGIEKMLPSGLSQAMKGYRFANEGMTLRNGDVVMKPEDVSALAALGAVVGIPSNEFADMQWASSLKIKDTQHFNELTSEIKHRYTEAAKDKDRAEMKELEARWMEIQAARKELGYTAQPMSTLIKAPQEQAKRERNTLHGIEFNKSSRRAVELLTGY